MGTSEGQRAVPLLGGRYEPRQLLGAGGQGCVVRAFDHHHGRLVALKVRTAPSDDDRRAMLAEARVLLGARKHPSIAVARHDFFAGDQHVLVMEDVDGEDLRVKLRRATHGCLPWTDVLGWVDDVAAAVDHLHTQVPRLVHGDITPANIVVSAATGTAVLVDLGTADGGDRSVTAGYGAPELAWGRRSPASDMFGLAATAHELFTGSVPHPGDSASWSFVPGRVRSALRAAIASGLSVDPARRPSAAELRDRLGDVSRAV